MKKVISIAIAAGLLTVANAQSTTVFGYSHFGQPIEVETFGDGPLKILVIGGQHGNELPSVPSSLDSETKLPPIQAS
ncbi:hypothetical protein CCB80_09420 [Armatimonadetes bacterium Uphvl-Ar1]|nr:hypothetical protein CCB80_09420 [Armatimonadetes bacterium Uphvl-Ar1]